MRSILALVVGFAVWVVAIFAVTLTALTGFDMSARIPSFIAFYLATGAGLIIAGMVHERLFKDIPAPKQMIRLIIVVGAWMAMSMAFKQNMQSYDLFSYAGSFAALLTLFIQNRPTRPAT